MGGYSNMAVTQSFGDMVAVRDIAGKYISKLGEKMTRLLSSMPIFPARAATEAFVRNFRTVL